jgi:hypothetical protein
MRIVFFLVLVASTVTSYCQVKFEKGYFITNSGKRVDCLIKNLDWKNNPRRFDYKLKENDANVITASIDSAQEFATEDNIKFVRTNAKIDESGTAHRFLSHDRNPVYTERVVFLKVVVEGKATLFSYEEGNLRRFFFQVNGSNIEPLVYKRFHIDQRMMGENNQYKQQIYNALPCNKISLKDTERLQYSEANIAKIFATYNNCDGTGVAQEKKLRKHDIFNLTVRPGVNASKMSIKNKTIYADFTFEPQQTVRIGLEFELVAPFSHGRWSATIEPTFQEYSGTSTNGDAIATISYKSLELPFGIRYNAPLNAKSRLTFGFAVVSDYARGGSYLRIIKPDNDPPHRDQLFKLAPRNNFAFGIGYKLKNRFSVEFRHLTARDLLQYDMKTKYTTNSLILGVTLF